MLSKPITSSQFRDENLEAEIEILSSSKNHTGGINCVLNFEDPFNRLVTCSKDKTIRIFHSKSGSCVKVLKKNKRSVNNVIRWEDNFLVASGDGTIKSYSIVDCDEKKTFLFKKGKFIFLLRISSDHFLAISDTNEMVIFSYSKEKVVKKMTESISSDSQAILSKDKFRYPNCFYVNTDDENDAIKRYNYGNMKGTKVEMEFKRHDKEIYSISSVVIQNEMLLCGGEFNVVYIYNTTVPSSDINFIRRISTGIHENITCLRTLINRYICVGDRCGNIHLFDTRNGFNKIVEHKLHSDEINEFDVLQCEAGTLVLASGSEDTILNIFSINKLEFESFDILRYEQTRVSYSKRKIKKIQINTDQIFEEEEIENEEMEEHEEEKVKKKKKKKKKKNIPNYTPPEYDLMTRHLIELKTSEDYMKKTDPVQDAQKFLDITKRETLGTPPKRKKKKKKKKRKIKDEDLIEFESDEEKEGEEGEGSGSNNSSMNNSEKKGDIFVMPRVSLSLTSFFNDGIPSNEKKKKKKEKKKKEIIYEE